MTDRPTQFSQPPQGEGGDQTVFEAGGLLAPLLEAGFDDDVREILELFLEACLTAFADIKEAIEEGELDNCADAAHSLFGSAGGIGAEVLTGLLARLEKACRAGDLRETEYARALLDEEKEKILPAIRRFISERREGPSSA